MVSLKRAIAILFGLNFLSLQSALAKDVLAVVAPLGTLEHDFVEDFKEKSDVDVRAKLVSLASDASYQLRQGTTVWDTVVSDLVELSSLSKQGRLVKLAERKPDSEQEASNEKGPSGVHFLPIYDDPIGFVCKAKKQFELSSWSEFTLSLVKADLIGDVVLALPLPIQVQLAHSVLNQELPNELALLGRARNHKVLSTWLKKIHWQTRSPDFSLHTEILSPKVSCLITFHSKFVSLSRVFEAYPAKEKDHKLVFVVPENKTIVRRLGVAVSAESGRPNVAKEFATGLQSFVNKGIHLEQPKKEAFQKFCPVNNAGVKRPDCNFERLGVLKAKPQVSESLNIELRKSHLAR